MKEMFVEKDLLGGWKVCQYWPAEIILKHPSRKRGIYIKAPWFPWADRKRWERFDGSFVRYEDASPKNANGYRMQSLCSWPEAREYDRQFTYTTKYGKMQTAILTARRERVRRVRYWLRWLPFVGQDADTLNIKFNQEMGSEAGTWKGGCIGTSCDVRPGETVKDAIDRFLAHAQRTHRWDR